MIWQKYARLGVGLFGIGVAIAVYAAMEERTAQTPAAAPDRLDPQAIIESSGARLQQERGVQRDFDVTSERQLYYEDGSSKLIGVEIRVRGRAGRDFVLAGREAQAAGNQQQLRLTGAVTLTASDGLVVRAEEALFSEQEALVRAPGPISFARGGMSGSGTGMTYDEANDILTILEQARVIMTGDGTQTPLDLAANTATLNRPEHNLALDGAVHALWGDQVIDGDRAIAHLTELDTLAMLALRGNGRVSGGSGALDGMTGSEIDLEYAEDGQTLERVVLVGNAALMLAGQGGGPGRRLTAERVDISLAPDGQVTRAEGRDNVTFELPAGAATPPRTVTARALDGTGQAGRGLTSARFSDDVVYQEGAARGTGQRTARARVLAIAFDADVVTEAVFSGSATFREEGLAASAAEAAYRPTAGTLRLTGADAGGPPHVADPRIDVVADAIDLVLDGPEISARRNVKTTLRPGGESQAGSALPGLLNGQQAAYVNADALGYQGASGAALYSGNAALWQGDTAIRADALTVNRNDGSLVATGNARSNIALDTGASTGRADRIRYDDAARTITYTVTVAPPAGAPAVRAVPPAGRRGGSGAAPPTPVPAAPRLAEVTGPQGDLRADRIDVVLPPVGNRVDRLEAFGRVTARVDSRVATGSRLTYFAGEERYVMSGEAGAPVTVVDACRTTSGRTLVFFKSTDRILVDGNEQARTQTTSSGPCPAPGAGS